MLDNLDFDGQFDCTPYVELDKNCKCHWSNFMSGNFAWRQAGSDKTTVSVATGQVEYYPLYISIGNVHYSKSIKPCMTICNALNTNLDDLTFTICCTQSLANEIISLFDPGILWNEFGIDDDIVVYLPALNSFMPDTLVKLQYELEAFHVSHEIFHAVKKPWHHSNCFSALGQMLTTNEWLDKLAAMQVNYVDWGMLPPAHDLPASTLSVTIECPANVDEEECGLIDEVVEGNVSLAHT
ncbi:hypothetical protein BDN71DRAFT_1430308 [Pleurotus eryngii]|uniref:Uncharacterized protein n=1 Tax=Pleurotus eryngii TaxID=5323 RepID=A0A9P5ZYH4_PLEER|nr:hypothetical protein BDN71DRAFT_1430308 [Pleurotus eryngii]